MGHHNKIAGESKRQADSGGGTSDRGYHRFVHGIDQIDGRPEARIDDILDSAIIRQTCLEIGAGAKSTASAR